MLDDRRERILPEGVLLCEDVVEKVGHVEGYCSLGTSNFTLR